MKKVRKSRKKLKIKMENQNKDKFQVLTIHLCLKSLKKESKIRKINIKVRKNKKKKCQRNRHFCKKYWKKRSTVISWKHNKKLKELKNNRNKKMRDGKETYFAQTNIQTNHPSIMKWNQNKLNSFAMKVSILILSPLSHQRKLFLRIIFRKLKTNFLFYRKLSVRQLR